MDEGTGIVHIAPGCGAEDFEIGRREELPVLVPVDEAGLFVEGYGELTGHSAHEVPDLVADAPRARRLARCARSPTSTATRTAGAAARS